MKYTSTGFDSGEIFLGPEILGPKDNVTNSRFGSEYLATQ
jgi:hypothetical protein